MWRRSRICLATVLFLPASIVAQGTHVHGETEGLGSVSFPISCQPQVQAEFNRGVALLHSFAYAEAKKSFSEVAEKDPRCAMAHWGMAMTYFRELWDPPIVKATIRDAQREIRQAQELGAKTERERNFASALAIIFEDAGRVNYRERAGRYEVAMRQIATGNPDDSESQIFYALALLANASPSDKNHSRQKQAAAILEPLWREYPNHPGIPHYLIHAYDNAELAPRGLTAARDYAKIAPAAPHALHMPSHIFTRLGMWDDSIASNLAARKAAHDQGDTGEELHAMDYLVYAYLQEGRTEEAGKLVGQVKGMSQLDLRDFKIAYAATAMPVRYAVERRRWEEATKIEPPDGPPPHVVAIGVWARGMGFARSGSSAAVKPEIAKLRTIEGQLRASGNGYWEKQVEIQRVALEGWSAQAEGKAEEAVKLMRQAADEEDAVEKLPVTPGPIVPAREQLGDLLLEQKQPEQARKEFERALENAPGRRGAVEGLARAREPG